VHAFADLGSALGMSVTAEGVETPEQLRMLRAESCKEVQGYLFSAPIPAAEVPSMIALNDTGFGLKSVHAARSFALTSS
jgi:EAL domain-containing protein (putative c-di-GMP-specific phosphodiesterase class I)